MTDIIVIGGGIVGLATALQIKRANPSLKLLVLEKENELAKHQTGNNSGVIHSGLYYKPGSLKATNCIRGYHLLIDFCRENEIPFELCGKVVVATSESELPLLENLFVRGQQNGLENLRRLSQPELKEIEPHVNGIKGIFVPQTGIVDYRQVAMKYGKLLSEAGAEIKLNEKVISIQRINSTMAVTTQTTMYEAKLIINCAGLYSDKVAAMSQDHALSRRIL
jgi:L-2-hydroxyglutarate oxidase